jgi:hypothetical protein
MDETMVINSRYILCVKQHLKVAEKNFKTLISEGDAYGSGGADQFTVGIDRF